MTFYGAELTIRNTISTTYAFIVIYVAESTPVTYFHNVYCKMVT